MSAVTVEDETFATPRQGYLRGDARFSRIYAEL
jgi:hypothetical protein